MTTHTPLRCSFSALAGPDADGYLVLMDTGNYPSFSSYLNQTWLWQGTDWHNTGSTLIDANGPLPGRSNQVMSYDGTNVMLFGGQGAGSGQIFNDTWVWTGTAWTKMAPATSPFGRYHGDAAFLTGTGTVMFGGFGGAGNGVYLNETWVWTGSGGSPANTWTQQVFANGASPSARIGHCMAASSSKVMMFGGVNSAGEFKNDLWSYNGSWTQLAPTNSPSVRGDACLAFDSVNSIFVLFGGRNQYNYLPETWILNSGGTAWTKIVVANGSGPAGMVGAQMAFDTVSGTTILFGGVSGSTNYPSNQTWSFSGSSLTWTQLG